MVYNNCPICGNKNDYTVIYKKNFEQTDFNQKVFSARRIPDKIHYQIVKCKTCELIRSNPIAKSSILNSLYKTSTLDYSKEINNLVETYLIQLKPILNKINTKDNILEIGCGNGFVLESLYKRGFTNVFGIEPSTDAVNKANKTIKKHIINKPLGSNIFPKNKFKLIFMFQTLDHIPNPNIFIKNCRNLLNNGGYVLAFNHNINSLSSKILKERSPIIDIEHTHLYSPETITKLFEKHKFHILDVSLPKNSISIKHLIWLTPMPTSMKRILLTSKLPLLNKKISVRIGNLCLIAQK
jgi:2-polyprenyl-3-methyl-5-hydroxy-6-metoxy-1,4-benzoquinol methylase